MAEALREDLVTWAAGTMIGEMTISEGLLHARAAAESLGLRVTGVEARGTSIILSYIEPLSDTVMMTFQVE